MINNIITSTVTKFMWNGQFRNSNAHIVIRSILALIQAVSLPGLIYYINL